MTLLYIAMWLVGIALVCLAAYGMHRWLLLLERRGYIYYLEKPRGSGGSPFFELDKLTRPSVEHVAKAMDADIESPENDGE